jgi:D-alanine transaminase
MKLLLSNNRIISRDEATISYLDRGYVFGDGIYEMFRVYKGLMFESEAHYRRLERSLREVKLQLPYSIELLDAYLRQLIEEEQLVEGTVYIQITRGVAPRTHAFPAHAEPVLTAYCSELARPHESMTQGIAVVTRQDIRWLRCDIKTLNLLPNIMAKQDALDHGANDVIFQRSGTVTESSSSNVLVVRGGSIYTHPANNLILHGITRLVLIDLAKELGIPFLEKSVQLEQLAAADEVFLASTTGEITPVVSIDGSPVGSGQRGPIVRMLQEAFQQRIDALA